MKGKKIFYQALWTHEVEDNNSLEDNLRTEKQSIHKREKYIARGVYQLTCPDCNKKYVGQSGRNFGQIFKEHLSHFKNNSNSSKFAQQLLEYGNTFGKMDDLLILYFKRKGHYMDTIQKFHIYKEAIIDNHLYDKHTVSPNKIAEVIIESERSYTLPFIGS
jgi:hypothetical protein